MKRLAPWNSLVLACLLWLTGCSSIASQSPPPLFFPTVTTTAAPAGPGQGTILVTYRGNQGQINAIAWSPEGKRIASASFDGVHLWDAATGQHLLTLGAPANALAWSPDGKRLLTGGFPFVDGNGQVISSTQMWDTTNGKPILSYAGHSDEVKAVAWSPDGKRIASAGQDSAVQVWSASTGKTLLTY